jgi:hypothetical protein
MQRSGRLPWLNRFARLVLSVVLTLGLMLVFWQSAIPGAFSAPGSSLRYGGYGISVGPHLESQPELLDEMGMDWVKVYDTEQIDDYPNRHILFRLERAGYPPDWDLEAWTDGLYDFARELDRRGVDAVEIGNEPNLAREWGNQPPDPAKYVDVLRRAYTAFKSEAPDIVVVSAGLAPTAGLPDGSAVDDLWFAQQMINYGAAQYMDAWGYHPYGFDQPPEANPYQHPYSFRRTELLVDLLRRNGVNKQVWLTEFGWVRDPAEEGVNCASDPAFSEFQWMAFDRNTQAAYTRRAMTFAARNWRWAGPMFLWNLNWNLYDTSYEPTCSNLRWYAILNRDGTPLPVFYAIQDLPRRPAIEFRPDIGAVARRLTGTVEAGCAGVMRLGSFVVEVTGAEGQPPPVQLEPANAPGRPLVWTSVTEARDGDEVEVMVDARDIEPGLYLIGVNLRASGTDRVSSAFVRGWLLVHHPSSPICVRQFGD